MPMTRARKRSVAVSRLSILLRNPVEAAQVTDEFRNKMESLRPLTLPGDEKSDQKGDTKTKRSWPRVGPDESIPEAEPMESGAEPPPAPDALVLEDQ